MNIKQLNQMPITDFLDKVGIVASYEKGENHWYISPIREPEQTPSFKVNTKLNRWYDYGIQQGGKLFDLAEKINPNLDVSSLVTKVNDIFMFEQQGLSDDFSKIHIDLTVQLEIYNPLAIVITEVRPLGGNMAISGYLQNRGVDIDLARHYCQEVYYQIGDKSYFAAGFKNRSGGYELRSQYFKGSSSPKDITHIQNGHRSVCVLEGFMDFLSLLTLRKDSPIRSDFVILNSVSFVDRSMDILKNYGNVFLYLDHDSAGRKALEKYESQVLNIVDASGIYQKFKDLNEYLSDRQKVQQEPKRRQDLKKPRGRSL
jgi:hypothetical protein